MNRTTPVMLLTSLLFALLFAVSALAVGIGEDLDPETVVALIGEDGVQRAEMIGGEYYFKPERLVLIVNVPVELTVKKEPGMVPHDIIMEAPEAGMEFTVSFDKAGEVISFTPTKTGEFPFYCGKKLLFFKSHRERGMEGLIEVVGPDTP